MLAEHFAPRSVLEPVAFGPWFDSIARQLLYQSRLVVAARAYRITEVETYYCGPGHCDPFAHANPIQGKPGHWYFHRVGGSFRGGSFKGVDITFGEEPARAGVFIRGIESIDGPSLVVDELLRLTRCFHVRELDAIIGSRSVLDPTSPIHLVGAVANELELPFACPRVGLSLKRANRSTSHLEFLFRPYRYLIDPHQSKKGRPMMVAELLRQQVPTAAIAEQLRTPIRTVDAYRRAFVAGQSASSIDEFLGQSMTSLQMCHAFGFVSALSNAKN